MIARHSLLALAIFALGGPAAAQVPTTPGEELHRSPAKQGWFWYLDPAKEEKKKEEPLPPPPAPAEPPKDKGPIVVIAGKPDKTDEEKCSEMETWTAECGFVDPGANFEFQAKQRDILLQQMSLRPDVPEAVEAAQRYMKWVVGKASQAANMWYFNRVQNPELDPMVKNPISEVGIALASRATEASQYEYFRIIREEGGVLFFFSRNDCQFCHDQAPYARRVARTMGLTLINIPLDGKCLPGFEGDLCGDKVKPEQTAILQVKVVPTMFLYVPANTWIRLSSGISSDTTVMANTVNFFSAYRAALLQGLDNGKGVRPSVSFNPDVNARPTGAVAESGKQDANLPDRARLLELMGYSAAK